MSLVIVSGALANKPFNGGNAWSRLGWACGFQKLGFDVCFVEQIAEANCVDVDGKPAPFERSANLAVFQNMTQCFGLASACALICDGGRKQYGLSLDTLRARAKGAVLFNFGGHLTCAKLLEVMTHRIYYDDDPGFTQFWHAQLSGAGARLGGHDSYFTVGANIGTVDCEIPTCGITWQHTPPPVVLENWPTQPTSAFSRFTTVASWRGAYGPIQHDGKAFGLKVHEFRKIIELPRRCAQGFEIALHIHPGDWKDMDALRNHGWRIVDPVQAAGVPEDFRGYVQGSGAEFSVAQGIYTATKSGWFSDRTVRYLASGKPALVQDTGFSRYLPVGQGLLAFRTLDEAAAGAESIVRHYKRHCLAARRIAEEYFDSDKVISRLAGEIGLELPHPRQAFA